MLSADDATSRVLAPVGELDAINVAEFRDDLRARAGEGDVVIDLSAVTFVDSAGLGAIIHGLRTARAAGHATVVVVTRTSIRRLLTMTGVDRLTPVVDSLEDASPALTPASYRADAHS